MSERNKELVRRYMEEATTGDEAAIDELLHPDVVVRFNGSDEPITGRDGYKNMIKLYRQAVPDFKVKVVDVVAEGDKVAVRWTARFKHTGDFDGQKATGKEGTVSGFDLIRIVDGKIVEITDEVDLAAVQRQVGVDARLPKKKAK
jgi:steroid delta-isomerase-like uncharacterized protein